MITIINKNVRIWREFNPISLNWNDNLFNSFDAKRNSAILGFNKERVAIKNRWFDVLTPNELFRKRNKKDGYYRVVYIQIDMERGEYYIGKANRPTWSELKRYQGSGLIFANKFKTSNNRFVRYYIANCETAEETEQLEASIVDKDLLSDEKCLNLIVGGGGTTKHPSIAKTSKIKREYMKNHPEQFKPMIEAAKKAFLSGDTPELRERSRRIKEVMSAEKYREMSRNRITKWKDENPKEYAEAKRKSHEKIKTPECQAKRQASLELWAKKHPEEYKVWQEKLISSRTSQKANEKRKVSLKKWNDLNSQKAKEYAQKRAKAAAAKTSKATCMIDLKSGKILQNFPSQHAAAKWLVENNKAKNMNCVSSINSVCLHKPCTTGYGCRKKAYGYVWRFASEFQGHNT
jgi:hypothetical protein